VIEVAGWEALADRVRACVACPELALARRTVVVGDAPAGARLLLVGEAPGAAEDEAGRPFVGKAGQLLDVLLDEAGVRRDEVAVINVLRCRPPGNRTPKPAEVERCRPWVVQQTALIDPELTVALGASAVKALLGRVPSLAAVRGEVHERDGRRIVTTYHPSAAIRFGPAGAPMAALRADLAWAVSLLGAGPS
jgi:DNA polymerase